MFSYSCAGVVALWNIGVRQGIACLSMSRLTCDDDGSSGCQSLRAQGRASHVLQSDGFAAVAASAGGGISAIVTVDAAAKQLLVCLLLLLLVMLLSVALGHSNHICAFGHQN